MRAKMQGWETIEHLLTRFWIENPELGNRFVVPTKVRLINRLYFTGIIAEDQVAERIVRHARRLESDLARSSSNAIRTLARCGTHGRLASFASKFAHFHNAKGFPMWDKYVQRALRNLREPGFNGWKWTAPGTNLAATYDDFRKQIIALWKHFTALDAVNVSFKTIDAYLYLKGHQGLRTSRFSAELRWACEQFPQLWVAL